MPREEFDEFDLDALDDEEEREEDELEEEWEEEEEDTDDEVQDILKDDQKLDYGREDLVRKLKSYSARTPELSGGDVDASWEYDDVGEEAVGGENPTPDQSDVDDEGKAVGITYDDNEELDTDDKLEKRDRQPWELNPESDPELGTRTKEEFQQPLHRMTGSLQGKRATESSAARRSAKAAKNQESKPAARSVRTATGAGRSGGRRGQTAQSQAGRSLSAGGRSTQNARRAATGSRRSTTRRATKNSRSKRS